MNEQHEDDNQLGEDFGIDSDIEIEELDYEPEVPKENKKNHKKVYLDYDAKKLEENLEEIWETRRAIVEGKQK